MVTALEHLTALDPAPPGVAVRLEQARLAQRRKALVDEITALHQAGRWKAVVTAAQELARLDPDDADPGGIVSDAQAKIIDAELADKYRLAIDAQASSDWSTAIRLYTSILDTEPGYRDAAARRQQCESFQCIADLLDQIRHHADAANWRAVIDVSDELAALDPAATDPEGLATRARYTLGAPPKTPATGRTPSASTATSSGTATPKPGCTSANGG